MNAEVKEATPEAPTMPVPSNVEPSRNVTVPVTGFPPVEATMAVKVTDAPEKDGLLLEVIEVDVGCRMVWSSGADWPPGWLGSPA
jgi:hypothetical protein